MFDRDMIIGFICGVNGGIATVYVGQPLDTVKVKMQMFPTLYNNAFSCLKSTFMKDGIYRGLYAGTVPALAANIAENSVLFCALEPCRKLMALLKNKSTSELTPLEGAMSGSSAAFFSTFVLCPTELVKCRQQALREMIEAKKSNLKITETGPSTICRSIWRQEGIRGFFHGLVPTFAREVPGYFCFFGAYELSTWSIMHLNKYKQKSDLSLFETGACGAAAGIALWTAIFPFDVCKSRIQISASNPESAKNQISMIQMLIHIFKTEGFVKLYSGLGPTVLRTIPATGALFIAVEYTRKFFKYVGFN